MKQKRQNTILNIINKRAVETQEELLKLLMEQGFNTTQATISRDIKELNIRKASYDGNKKKYVAFKKNNEKSDSYIQVMTSCVISIDSAENIIVIKTVPGMAMAVGAAIDTMNIDGIVGCIAGDDTLFLAIKYSSMVVKIMGEIKNATKYAH